MTESFHAVSQNFFDAVDGEISETSESSENCFFQIAKIECILRNYDSSSSAWPPRSFEADESQLKLPRFDFPKFSCNYTE